MEQPAIRAVVVTFLLAVGAAACSDSTSPGDETPGPTNPWDHAPQSLSACSSTPPFTRALVEPGDLVEVGPMGFVNPPGKTFPTPHMGFSTFWEPGMIGAEEAPVWAPGDIVVTEVAFVRYSNPETGEVFLEDYALRFQPCLQIVMYLGHLSELAPAVLDSAGPIPGPGAECQEPYLANLTEVQGCLKRTEFRVPAGDRLGTMGGPGQSAMDVGLFDHTRPPVGFLNPERAGGRGSLLDGNRIACPLEYFVPGVRAAYEALISRADAPRCGQVMQDVPGTLQGRWFVDDLPGDDRHGGFFMDWLDPNRLIVSMGHSVPSIPAGGYGFRAENSGRVNRAFRDLGPGPEIYCFERRDGGGRWLQDVVILVRFADENRVLLEGVGRTTCGDPDGWSLSGAAVEFRR